MNRIVLTFFAVFLMAISLRASETLFSVSTANLYNLKDNAIVTFDYDQNYIPQLFLFDIQTKTKKIIPLYGTEVPYFLLSGFNGKEIVYVNFNPTNKYYIDYYNIETAESKRIVTDGAYKEFLWCSGDIVVWIDYRNSGGNSSNSEVYMYDLRTSTETRITNDSYYQAKAVTDGKHIVWVEYRNDLYGNIVLYDIETGQSFNISPVNYQQDNPQIYGNFIVWEDYLNAYADSENVDTYIYNIETKKVSPISTELGFQGAPYIYYNMVVWEDAKIANSESNINSFDLNTSKYLPIAAEQYYEYKPKIDQNIITFIKIENDNISFVMQERYPGGVIVGQPSNSEQCEASNTNFTVTISNDISQNKKLLQWYKGSDKLVENTKYSGVNQTRLTIKNLDIADSGSYHLELTLIDENILFISDTAELSIKQSAKIVSQPDDTIIVSEGEQVTFGVSVSGTGPFEYSWYKDDVLLNDFTSNQISINDFTSQDEGEYYCKVVNECNTAVSKTIHLQLEFVGQPPSITTQPNEFYTINIGASLNITIEAVGTEALHYQWYKNNLLMPDDTSNIYYISNVSADDKGTYYCIVRNDYGTDTSSTATVDVITGIYSQNISDDLVLYPNEPNPFSDVTNISFYLPSSYFVKVAIYDILGSERAILVNKVVQSGKTDIIFRASEFGLNPGVYFYSISTKDFFVIKKMVLVH